MSKTRKVVSNTTPIIALSEIGELDLLKKLYGMIFISESVLNEIKTEPAFSDVRANNSWIVVEKIEVNEEVRKMYKPKLHSGEVESMILAQKLKADIIILDDYAARKTAQYLGLKVTGTLGVIIKAKQEGLISEAKPLMEKLIENGLFISDNVLREVLSMTGEQ